MSHRGKNHTGGRCRPAKDKPSREERLRRMIDRIIAAITKHGGLIRARTEGAALYRVHQWLYKQESPKILPLVRQAFGKMLQNWLLIPGADGFRLNVVLTADHAA